MAQRRFETIARYFLIFVGVNVMASLSIFIQSTVLLACFFLSPDLVAQPEDEGTSRSIASHGTLVRSAGVTGMVGLRAWLVFVISSILLSLVAGGLTGHLLFFHVSLGSPAPPLRLTGP